MAGHADGQSWGTVVGDPDLSEVSTLVMPLSAISGVTLLAPPAGEPLASIPGARAADGLPVQLLIVTAALEPTLIRRIRVECTELEAILTDIDPALVLPVLDHGVDEGGRPYLMLPRPGVELAEAGVPSMTTVVTAARAAAAGLDALAARRIIGPPPGLWLTATGGVVLGTPLPPVLIEVDATLGTGTGHEPPEVLGGAEWTPAGQVYSLASQLWTLLSGQSPYGGDKLARLAPTEPPRMRRSGVPESVVTVLRGALATDPAQRPTTPGALAAALGDAALYADARPLGSQYLLDTEIGRGASGHVWAGRRRSDNNPVAVKLLRGELAEDEQSLTRFVREFRVLLKLSHPHLVRVHDLVVEGGVLGIVMDLVDGEDLRRVAGRGQLSAADAAALLAQTASGLAAVHAAGVVHRDVKPENVLVTQRDGRPAALLSDFGIARAVEGSAHTQTIGTPAYLAPELVGGRPPGPAADVYALGVMAYELLAGYQPFKGATMDAFLRAHLEETAARPAGLDDAMWDLLAACLAKTPEERPSAEQVAARWATFTVPAITWPSHADAPPQPWITERRSPPSHGPELVDANVTATSARPLAPRPVEPRPRGRRKALVLTAIAVLIVGLGTGIGLAYWQSRAEAPTGTPPASQPYPVVSTVSVDSAGVATLTWGQQASTLPGFDGYVVLDVSGDSPRPLSTTLDADVTSYQVEGLRPGRRACFWVIAVGVTAPPPAQLPPFTCTTPRSPTPGGT